MGNVAGVYSIMQHKMRVLQVSSILASRSDAPDRRRRTGMRAPAPQQLAAFASTRRSASRGLTPPRPRRRRSLRRGRAARRNPAPAAARRPRRRPRPARPLRNPTSSPAIFVDHVAMWNMRENGRAEIKIFRMFQTAKRLFTIRWWLSLIHGALIGHKQYNVLPFYHGEMRRMVTFR